MAGPNLFDVLSKGIDSNGIDAILKTPSKGQTKSAEFSSLISQVNSNLATNKTSTNSTISTVVKDSSYSPNNRIKEKDISSINTIKEKLDSSKNTVDDFSKEIIDTVSDELEVDSETVENAMSVLGLSAFDLLNPQNLASLTANIKDVNDVSLMILDGDFQNLLSNVLDISQNFMQELGLNSDEMAEIISMLQVVDSDIGIDINELNLDQAVLDIDNSVTDLEENPLMQTSVLADTTQNAEQTDSELSVNDNNIVIVEGNNQSNVSYENMADNESDDNSKFDEPNKSSKEIVTKNAETSDVNDNLINSFENTINANATLENIQANQNLDSYTSIDTMDIIEQIVENTKVSINDEVSSIDMQLNPEKLGKVYLNVSAREGSVNAQLTVSSEAVKEALEEQLATLRENLNQAGIKVDAVEVTVSSHEFERNLEQNQDREQQEGRRQEENSNRRRNINLASLDELSGVMSEEETLVAQMMKDNGNSVDLTA